MQQVKVFLVNEIIVARENGANLLLLSDKLLHELYELFLQNLKLNLCLRFVFSAGLNTTLDYKFITLWALFCCVEMNKAKVGNIKTNIFLSHS